MAERGSSSVVKKSEKWTFFFFSFSLRLLLPFLFFLFLIFSRYHFIFLAFGYSATLPIFVLIGKVYPNISSRGFFPG